MIFERKKYFDELIAGRGNGHTETNWGWMFVQK